MSERGLVMVDGMHERRVMPTMQRLFDRLDGEAHREGERFIACDDMGGRWYVSVAKTKPLRASAIKLAPVA